MIRGFNPTVGKNVLETLTTGMYEDARFIFREYIQNAADQIDLAVESNILNDRSEGLIVINIHKESHKISVEDNATGIASNSVLQFLGDVASSQKDRTQRKGFRGIGRLGGLGYCDKLIFETSYKGEDVKSRMILDARTLRRIILNKGDYSNASSVISAITSIERTPEEEGKHYFKVILENVSNEKILNEESVWQYLSMVAPVPFDKEFAFVNDIKLHFKLNSFTLDEYNIILNDNNLYKAYKNSFSLEDGTLSELIGVDFIDVYNDEEELIALCWYGFRDFSNILISESDYERGIRIRTKNITIGDETTLKPFFGSERTNLRFIGEIHTISESFIPNARRDYFTENNTCLQFEERLKAVLKIENIENRLAQTASRLHNRKKEIIKYREGLEQFESNKSSFTSAAVETYHLDNLRTLKNRAVTASQELAKIKIKTETDQKIQTLYEHIIGGMNTSVNADFIDNARVSRYDPPRFSKLSTNESNIVNEIFFIIEEELPFIESEALKRRIFEKYN